MRNTSLKRSGMARVNEGSHSFTCHPHGVAHYKALYKYALYLLTLPTGMRLSFNLVNVSLLNASLLNVYTQYGVQ